MSYQLESIVYLYPEMFDDQPRPVFAQGELSATAFRYASGVCGLRLENALGVLELLPFQGQQIWSAVMAGRELAMRSMFTMPLVTPNYLETYGAFLIHCGATVMGVPSAEDTHPLHGELPNAAYSHVRLLHGEDAHGSYLALTGDYHYTRAFHSNYRASPLTRLYAGSSLFHCSMHVHNLKQSPMELMYLAHVNFRPADGAQLIYSAPCDPAHVRVRQSIPSHLSPGEDYRQFLLELAKHPEKHNVLHKDLRFDPEVVFYLDYIADSDGWAHTLQRHPDGSADYIAHRPAQLPKGIRWICRTADQDALGMVLPATAEPEGYLAEKAKGNLHIVPAQGHFQADMQLGVVSAEESERLEQHIHHLLG